MNSAIVLEDAKCKSGIYKIINHRNKRIYVGSTINFHIRNQTHWRLLRNNKHCNPFLQNDWNKCGEDAFQFEILELVPIKKQLIIVEQRYLDIWFDDANQCYNLAPTAGNMLGFRHSKKTKKKMSLAGKGKRKPCGFGKRISKALKGIVRPKGRDAPKSKVVYCYDRFTGKFISEYGSTLEAQRKTGAKGVQACATNRRKTAGGFVWKYYFSECITPVPKYKPTKEHKERISKKLKGRKLSAKECVGRTGPTNPNAKKVAQYDLSGNFIRVWDYMSQAAQATGINLSSMSLCCAGKQKTANGFVWKQI